MHSAYCAVLRTYRQGSSTYRDSSSLHIDLHLQAPTCHGKSKSSLHGFTEISLQSLSSRAKLTSEPYLQTFLSTY